MTQNTIGFEAELSWREQLPPGYQAIDDVKLGELLELAEKQGVSLLRACRFAWKRRRRPRDPSAYLSWAICRGYSPGTREEPLES